MGDQDLIKEFMQLEVLGEQLRKRAYKARVRLERVYAPAPKRGKKSEVISEMEKAKFIAKFRTGLNRKKLSKT